MRKAARALACAVLLVARQHPAVLAAGERLDETTRLAALDEVLERALAILQ